MKFTPPISPLFDHSDYCIDIQRSDLVDEVISGNKWYKLKYVMDKVADVGARQVLTFGGAFSNHIVATAAMGARKGISTVGVIRGDELSAQSNPTLRKAVSLGMKLDFVSREDYQRRLDQDYHAELAERHGYFYLVPEGGAHYLGVNGCMEMIDERAEQYDVVACAAGTGTMASGLAAALPDHVELWVFPVLKGGAFILDEMKRLLMQLYWDEEVVAEKLKKVKLLDSYHFGGYGKVTDELVEWINDVMKTKNTPLDPIYTAKAAWGLQLEMANSNSSLSNALLIHSGGLQGVEGFNEMRQNAGKTTIG